MSNRNPLDGILEPIFKAFDVMRDLFFKLISYPFEWWNKLPGWVHTSTFIFLFIVACFILIYIIKTKDQLWELEV